MMSWHGNAFRITCLCEGILPGGHPHKGPEMWIFNIFVDISLNKLLDKQPSAR